MMSHSLLTVNSKVMDKEWIFVGTDVSKYTLDFTAITKQGFTHDQVKNDQTSIQKYFHKLQQRLGLDESSFCFGVENTGRYSWPVLSALSNTQAKLYLLSPLHLKLSMGITRGKNDTIDSKRIALFLSKNQEQLTVYKPPRKSIQQLSLLLSRRDKLKRQLKAESSTREELYCVEPDAVTDFIKQQSSRAIKQIKELICEIEARIEELIKKDEQLKQKLDLVTSVPGVGKVLAWYLLVKTNEFESITEPRKLACYAGVAPFEHSSGISIKGRTRVSPFADKQLKKTLHMAALRVVQLDGEMKDYFQRKVAEGKNKMSVLNALRNKIIHRVAAVIRDNRPYQTDYKPPLVLS